MKMSHPGENASYEIAMGYLIERRWARDATSHR
jgi:hypothetical protein